MRMGKGGVLRFRRRRGARMIFDDRRGGMIVQRRRRLLAGKTVARANERDDARDNGAEQRQQNDGYIHAALAPALNPHTRIAATPFSPYEQADHALALQ